MLRTLSGHLTKNVVAYLALFVALGGTSYAALKLPKNSVGSGQIKNGAVAKRDLARAVRTQLAKAGVPGAQGAQGLPGLQGQQGQTGGRGPSFGDGMRVGNVTDFACAQEVPVGEQTIAVTEPSRIWVHGHGAVEDDNADPPEYVLWLRLRDAGDSTTLAVSTGQWGRPPAAPPTPEPLVLSSGGLLLATDEPDNAGPVFVAQPGTYILQLTVATQAVNSCVGSLPDFGFNQGNSMGYVLLGTG